MKLFPVLVAIVGCFVSLLVQVALGEPPKAQDHADQGP